eukprot:3938338-Rhodomonas_salina.2
MQAQAALSVDDAVAFLFPQENLAAPYRKDTCATDTEDVESYLAVLPSSSSEPICAASDTSVFDHTCMNTEVSEKRTNENSEERTVAFAAEEVKCQTPAHQGSSPAPESQKKRLVAWTSEEHQRFVFALERLRTEDTEAYNSQGKKTRGLGPGIAELIALA